MHRIAFALLTALFVLSGCNFGPHTLQKDRFDYSHAVANSFKEEMLLNVVKIRYLDPPTFFEVNQVVNQYNLEGQMAASGNVLSGGMLGNTIGLEGSAKYYDRPTITYVPLKGDRFARDFMTPVPPPAVVAMANTGWPIDILMRLCVESMNGINQWNVDEHRQRTENPDYGELIRLLSDIQSRRLLAFRLEKRDERTAAVLLIKRSSDPEAAKTIEALRDKLGLSKETDQFTVRFGTAAINDKEIAIETRSLLGMLIYLSLYVNPPGSHLAKGWAVPGYREGHASPIDQWPMRIHSSVANPIDTYAKVRYEGHWYYVDKSDIRSKRLMAILMLIANVAQSPSTTTAPLVTIPAG